MDRAVYDREPFCIYRIFLLSPNMLLKNKISGIVNISYLKFNKKSACIPEPESPPSSGNSTVDVHSNCPEM